MSLYRQTGRFGSRALVVTAMVAAAAALAGGYALGRATAPEPSLGGELDDLREALEPARQALTLTPTEYSQAVRGGKVVEQTEYEAAKSTVTRASDTIAGERSELRELSAERADALEAAVAQLVEAVEGAEPADRVRRLSETADRALDEALGGDAR